MFSRGHLLIALASSLGLGACYGSERLPVARDASAADATDAAASEVADTVSTGGLSADERAQLVYMVEEEKLARDVYALNAAGLRVFSNIAAAEQRHMDAASSLAARYGVDDPTAGRGEGSFMNAELQALYDTLATRSRASIVEALRVGAEIEEIDLRDLEEALATTEHDDIAQLYEALAQGSRNHLAAFYRNLSARGVSYTPQHLDPSEFAAIVGQ
jgi:hypothetical protein